MKFEIKPHKNGFAVHVDDDDQGYVLQDDCTNEVDAFASFLCTLLNEFGPSECGSRYSNRRIHIHVTKGDKCEGPRGESEFEDCRCMEDE